jgi:hypothetical protein
MTELEKLAKATGINHVLEYRNGIPDEELKAFAEAVIDWVARQHFEQCKEVRPIQQWILGIKPLLHLELTSSVTTKEIKEHSWARTE